MNYGIIRNIIGKIMILSGVLMLLPLIVAAIYQETLWHYLAFIIPALPMIGVGFLFNIKKASPKMQAREGFIIVALSWILMSLVGAVPLIVTGYYPNYFDALFEITSGFTTTGASVVSTETMELMNIEGRSILFWRSFSHWIGGMGVLVLILAMIPESEDGSSIHILRAESPGPQVGRLVSKMKAGSRILYIIYFGLTALEVVFLVLGPNHEMSFFDSLLYAFGTAGTGGFAINSISVELYSAYYQYVIGAFMLLFGINFTIYFLLLTGKFKDFIKSEELLWYITIVLLSVGSITGIIYNMTSSFEEAFRLSFFQVSSIISTTGYSTTNFDNWPTLAKVILVLLMAFGAMAGSTAGGIKISRIIILIKSALSKVKSMVNHRQVTTVKVNGEVIKDETIESTQAFFLVYIIILFLCAFLISVDGHDLTTNFSASLACISNIGPGFSAVGPYGSYAIFSNFSKVILSLEMIAGRLEIFPLLLVFNPKTWIKRI